MHGMHTKTKQLKITKKKINCKLRCNVCHKTHIVLSAEEDILSQDGDLMYYYYYYYFHCKIQLENLSVAELVTEVPQQFSTLVSPPQA
jgi:hypothetical protein